MSIRVVIDPVTRIQGHLRLEATLDGGGAVSRAWCSSTMVRGIEPILGGRDPREAWAITERIGGGTLVHGLASVRAVEAAVGAQVPPNAELIRNLMLGGRYLLDHVNRFYRLQALDWVDPTAAVGASAERAAALAEDLGPYPNASPGYFERTRGQLARLLDLAPGGPLAGGWWGHPAYQLPPELGLVVLAHGLDALAWQRDAARLLAIFGGKDPHPCLVVGGVPCALSLASGNQAGTALDIAGLERVRGILADMRAFVEQVLWPDTLAVAGHHREWAERGEGLGRFLCCGDFPLPGGAPLIPAGVILDRDLTRPQALDLAAEDQVREWVAHSWYRARKGSENGLHPFSGRTEIDYTGPTPPYTQLGGNGPYSWLKSARWRGQAMEVGPLARVLVLTAHGNPRVRVLTDEALGALDLPFEALYSTLGRMLATAIESRFIAESMAPWFDALLANVRAGDLATFADARWSPAHWPRDARGVGAVEAPAGALGHWLVISGGRVGNYQVVGADAWNLGPRDAADRAGPAETALEQLRLADAERPLELLRTLRTIGTAVGGE